MGVMTNTTIVISESSVASLDFTSNTVPTYGTNARVQMADGNMALWTGNVNTSEQIRFSGSESDANSIKDHILADPLNVLGFTTFSVTGYLSYDVDLNGFARFSGSNNDSNIIKDNILGHPSNVLNFPTFTISPTVPNSN